MEQNRGEGINEMSSWASAKLQTDEYLDSELPTLQERNH